MPNDTMKADHLPRWNAALAALENGLLQRDVAARALLLAALAGEHVLLLGPPGTAKSELARRLKALLPGARYFERLLTRFSVPEELFGPLSLRALEEDRYERLVEGYLPAAEVAFLDEVFKANSAILNTLLGLLHERQFDNGAQRIDVPLVCLVGASNETPQDESLHAFFDRFLLRIPVLPVDDDHFADLLCCDMSADAPQTVAEDAALDTALLQAVRSDAGAVTLGSETVALLREARARAAEEHWVVSDRRWRQLAHLLQVQAASRGATETSVWDTWVLPFVLSQDAHQVNAWTEWFMTEVAALKPIETTGLERAAQAFEQQLDVEQRAPADSQDDSAGKLALARAISGPGGSESELVRITSDLAHKRYGDLHVRTRVLQMADVINRAESVMALVEDTMDVTLGAMAAHYWLPSSWRERIEANHRARAAQVRHLRDRLLVTQASFAGLPRLDESDPMAAVPPAAVAWGDDVAV
ncbi:AAA family ATPase [Hydrogenophaga sp. 5NK40-0174]|uniref:AAA family ATPase n=1 Tax=Hydrogenophaga sp. 5NK40-0174 TaxID=3127649 RepID=UPI0031065C8A